MIRRFARLLAIAFCFVSTADQTRAAPMPAALRGKSIVVKWTESGTMRSVYNQAYLPHYYAATIVLYVSDQGRIFSSLKGDIGKAVLADYNQVSGSGHDPMQWRFEKDALVAINPYIRGRRRTTITFQDGMTRCAVDVTDQKVGTAPVRVQGANGDTSSYDLLDNKVDARSCAVQQGNVFAKPQ